MVYVFAIILAGMLLLLFYSLISLRRSIQRKNQLESDKLISTLKYNEEEIVNHLQFIIDNAIDEYMAINVIPKNIYYIKETMQNEMCDYLQKEVPKRISKTLVTQLSIIVDDSYIGTFIGNQIYFTVTQRIVDYNINSAYSIPGANGNKKQE